MLEILDNTKEIKNTMQQHSFHMKMDTTDISNFFPIRNDEAMETFMKQDDDWHLRRKESYFHIFHQ